MTEATPNADVFQVRLASLHAACCAECGLDLPTSEVAEMQPEIAKAALAVAVRGLPTGAADSEPTRKEMRRRNAMLRHQQTHMTNQLAPKFLDPITGVILWSVVEFVIGKVLAWLYSKWFGDTKFAAECQACAAVAT